LYGLRLFLIAVFCRILYGNAYELRQKAEIKWYVWAIQVISAKRVETFRRVVDYNILRNYLKTITLSEAKGLIGQNNRFLAALGMTFCVLR